MCECKLPLHLQEEIMKRLPVKSLIRFRSVSKEWKSLIDSSEFIAAHSLRRHTQPQHLLVYYENTTDGINYACYVDDETLFQQRPVLTVPLSLKQLVLPDIVGITHGLVCFYCAHNKLTIVWNPSIRKSIVVNTPDTQFVGFGVCRVTTDPKIVAIKQLWDKSNIEATYRCEVMVYTLSSGRWRILSSNLPTKPFIDLWSAVAAGGFIYWRAQSPTHNMLMSFDVTNESFEMIDLPTSLAHHDPLFFHFAKLRDSLAILQYDEDRSIYTVWIMEDGIQRSFTQLFTIQARRHSFMGFRKSEAPIMHFVNGSLCKLVVYEPNSQHNIVLKISGHSSFYAVESYMETLLLLGRSDCSSH
ncbi:hypothetical protein L1887_36994 [Cichorium endivia]|nr:hypothetical protein L1887_36994 [Cichorium endivia]